MIDDILNRLEDGDLETIKYEVIEGRLRKTVAAFFIKPIPEQEAFCESLVRLLDAKYPHGGLWKVYLAEPADFWDKESWLMRKNVPTLIYIVFTDKDGNPQFRVNIEDPFWEVWKKDLSHWAEACDTAHTKYLEWMQAVDIKDWQKKNVAKGESLTNPSAQPHDWT